MINNTELNRIADCLTNVNLAELAKSYEAYSYDYDCRSEAKAYDAKVASFAKTSEVTVAWYEKVLAFSKEYQGKKDVLKYVTKQDELQGLLDKGSKFQSGSANYLDEVFAALCSMPKSRGKLERGREFAADFDKQPKLVTSKCKVVNKTAIVSFLATLKTEETYLNYEDKIADLASAKTRNLAWCDKVDALWAISDKEKLTNCDNYNVLKDLKAKADYVRLEYDCKEYTATIEKGADYEKVLQLDKELSKHLTACRTVIADFDKKWAECVKQAQATAQRIKEEAEYARMVKECKEYTEALGGKADHEKVLQLDKDVAKHLTACRTVITDFDKKWAECVKQAQATAQRIKEEAEYARMVKECKEYTEAIAGNASYDKVLQLNQDVSKHLTACRTVIADFDKKWAECVKNAQKVAQDLKDKLERARMEKECKEYLAALAGTVDYETVLKLNKDVGKHITSLRKLVPDFDDKWAKCVGNAEALAQQAKNKAERLRLEKECKDYVAALAGKVNFDKVLELNEEVDKHLTSLHKLIPDFDEDWAICVSNAHILYQRQADEWYNLAVKADSGAKKFEYFRKSAEYGHPFAMYQLGKCYQEGMGTSKSGKDAFSWYQKALDNGVAVANFALGYCYRYKIGCSLDDKKAFAMFSKYIDSNNPNSRDLCAWELGLCYEKGEGASKDKVKAFTYYEMAAKLGNVQAMYDVGRCYAKGIGVTSSEDNALAWYEKSEAQGHADAKKEAEAIRKVRRINKLNNEIDACYLKAKKGDVDAQYQLAEYYFTGNGVTQSYKDAFIWYEKAAKRGHKKAMEKLGDCYFNGYGTKQSYSAAEKWYNKSMK